MIYGIAFHKIVLMQNKNIETNFWDVRLRTYGRIRVTLNASSAAAGDKKKSDVFILEWYILDQHP